MLECALYVANYRWQLPMHGLRQVTDYLSSAKGMGLSSASHQGTSHSGIGETATSPDLYIPVAATEQRAKPPKGCQQAPESPSKSLHRRC